MVREHIRRRGPRIRRLLLWRSVERRTEELIADSLLHPTMGDYSQAMSNGRSTTEATRICHNALLPFIPQLCEMDVLQDRAAAHKIQFPAKRKRRPVTNHGITLAGVEEFTCRALAEEQQPCLLPRTHA
jgi:hypothetical protein